MRKVLFWAAALLAITPALAQEAEIPSDACFVSALDITDEVLAKRPEKVMVSLDCQQAIDGGQAVFLANRYLEVVTGAPYNRVIALAPAPKGSDKATIWVVGLSP